MSIFKITYKMEISIEAESEEQAKEKFQWYKDKCLVPDCPITFSSENFVEVVSVEEVEPENTEL